MRMDLNLLYSDGAAVAGEEQPPPLNRDAQIERLRTLQKISCKLNSKLDVEDAMVGILDEAIRAVGAERGCLLLVNELTDKLEVRLSRHLRISEISGRPFRFSRTVIQRVWREGEPVFTANAAEDPILTKADSVIRQSLRSILCVPLHVQGQRIGVLYLDNRLRAGQFQEDDLALVVAIADQAALALRNAQLYDAAQQELAERKRVEESLLRHNRELELLNQASQAFNSTLRLNQVLATVLEGVRHLLDVTACSIWLIDPEIGDLVCRQASGPSSEIVPGRRLALGEGLAGQVASSGERQVVQDTTADARFSGSLDHPTEEKARSLLCVPLRAKRGVIGVILLVDRRANRFGSTDLRWVEALAAAAASAIENAQLHSQIRQLAAEKERQRLARELHDTVTQSLYSIGMAAQTLLKLLVKADLDNRVAEAIEHILALSQSTLSEMRERLQNLHPTALADQGLIRALSQHIELLSTQYLLSIEFETDLGSPRFAVQQKEAVYYIAREALWNVVKYAGATRANVLLTEENGQIILSIVDDGNGFDPAVFVQEETMGLRNMKQRAELLGGTFNLETEPGHGTRITVRIPASLSEDIPEFIN